MTRSKWTTLTICLACVSCAGDAPREGDGDAAPVAESAHTLVLVEDPARTPEERDAMLQRLRVSRAITLAAADFAEFSAAIDEDPAGIVMRAEDHAVVDAELLEFVLGERDGASLDKSSASAAGVCIRTPLGPGKAFFDFDGAGWRYKGEGSDKSWYGARRGEFAVDGVHRDGRGCSVHKIPTHCTATIRSSGSIDCCCNAAASIFEGRCRNANYKDIGAAKPPGCN